MTYRIRRHGRNEQFAESRRNIAFSESAADLNLLMRRARNCPVAAKQEADWLYRGLPEATRISLTIRKMNEALEGGA